MTTENSLKSKKYVVTTLVSPDESPLGQLVEKQLCRCDTLKECADFIVIMNTGIIADMVNRTSVKNFVI